MKKLLFVFMFLASIAIANASVSVHQPYYSDDSVLLVSINNPAEDDWEDVRITVHIPVLDVYETTRSQDIDGRDRVTRVIELDVPQSAKGYYIARVLVDGSNFREVEYSWVYFS